MRLPWHVQLHCPRICSRATGGGGGGSGSGSSLLLLVRAIREVYNPLDLATTICLGRGRIWVPASHLGGSGPGKSHDGGPSHPKPDAYEWAPVLLTGLWGDIEPQCLLPSPLISQAYVSVEPLHISSLC